MGDWCDESQCRHINAVGPIFKLIKSVILEEMCCLVGFPSDNGTFTRMLLCGWDLVKFSYIPHNKVSSFYNFTHLFHYSNTCIIFLIWQIQRHKLIHFEKCLDSSMRNVNSKFFSASCMDQFINLFIKMNNINGRFELPTEVIKNAIFYDTISCSLYETLPPFWRNVPPPPSLQKSQLESLGYQ